MSSLRGSWYLFVQQLNQFQSNPEIDLLRVCLNFRLSLTEYFKEQNIYGSSEDVVNLFTELDALCPLPQNVQILKQIEGINIALVDYSKFLYGRDNENWMLIDSELGHTTGLLNQLTSFIAFKLYSTSKERLKNRVTDPSRQDNDAVKQFATNLLCEIRQIKLDLDILNTAIENETVKACDLFIQFWINPKKSKLACSVLASNEELCGICFNNYKILFLKLIEDKEKQLPRKLALNTNFLAFFAKQQSFSLIEKSKNRFLQSEENIILLSQQQSRIEKTGSIQVIAADLDALSLNYKRSLISRLIDMILKTIFCSYDSRPQTVSEAQDLRDILHYLEENCTTPNPEEENNIGIPRIDTPSS
ncbi:hypothetical protein [Legionella drozanskii]|uniref:Uncharacterized protein n=1 Tax=Legionella drozanskii LLAP-1 TaxID=1212489 RepID=A0A0W0SMS3_9GAMM|nr:hypothetical protein [Legionella drozanskii]KTC84635.1 hypothetical protein Ldro_2799 [Legionella drozanskii LLAP-1]